jgi:hypothetical protein
LAQTATEVDGVALDGEPRGGHEQGREEGERQKQHGRRKGKGREPPPPPQHWIRPPRHGQRRRPAVTGACALSAVSVVTARCWVGGEQHGRGHRRTRLETGMGR